MATYKEIHGVKVQYRDSDATAIEGDVWYNSSTGKLRMYAALGAWSSGGNLTTGRKSHGSAGTQTANLVYGGDGPTASQAISETYDGSSWTEVADLNTARANAGGTGTSSTAALSFGGFRDPPPGAIAFTELWNGTNWTEVNDMTLANNGVGGAGTSTAALAFGGNSPRTITQSWNGTNWSNENSLTAGTSFGIGAGTQTLALAVSGQPPATTAVEEWTIAQNVKVITD